MRRWELVLFGFGVLITVGWVLVPTLGQVTYRVFAGDCGTYDLFCELDSLVWLFPGVMLGVVAAVTVTYVVVRRWRQRPPHRVVAWLIGVVLPVAVVTGTVLVANMIFG